MRAALAGHGAGKQCLSRTRRTREYDAVRFGLGPDAGEEVGVPQREFQRELGLRKIPLHYDQADLASDLQAVRELTKQ